MNEFTHTSLTKHTRSVAKALIAFMANRTELDGTMLHYLAVQQAMVSLHRPVHSKITLTCSLT